MLDKNANTIYRYIYTRTNMGSAMLRDHAERRLKLRELRILLAVVKAGSMAKGAAALGISQPNVSKAISDLEHALGVNLLDRSARGIEATTYGLAVITRAAAAFDELRHAVEDVAFLADPTAGELRIGLIDWAAAPVGLAIDRISRRHPRIAFDVISADSTVLQRELKGRNIELFVAGRLDSLSKEDFETEILYNDQIIIVADSQHPLARRRRSIELSELTNETWVMPPKDTTAASDIRDAFCKKKLAFTNTIINTYSFVLQQHLLATGRYIGVLPNSMLQSMAEKSSLKVLPVGLPMTGRQVGIVVLKRRMLSPIARLFIETLCSVVRKPTKAKMRNALSR
jgi:DNA-binding transcriptional LysR family regulator